MLWLWAVYRQQKSTSFDATKPHGACTVKGGPKFLWARGNVNFKSEIEALFSFTWWIERGLRR